MQDTYQTFENKYLDNIKTTGFIRKLQKDLVLGSSPAGHRLYAKLQKLCERNELIQNGGIGIPYSINEQQPGCFERTNTVPVVNVNDLRTSNIGNHVVGSVLHVGCLPQKLEKYTPETIAAPVFAFIDDTKNGLNVKDFGEQCDRDGYMKVALWLKHVKTYNRLNHFDIVSHELKGNYASCFTAACTADKRTCLENNSTLVNPYDNKMSVFCINVPGEFENSDGNMHGTATRDDVIDVSKNVYNRFNYKVHMCIWCPCLLFFVFIFCIPAVIYMHKSDKYFHLKDADEASFYGRISTVLYISGLLAALLFYCALALFLTNFT